MIKEIAGGLLGTLILGSTVSAEEFTLAQKNKAFSQDVLKV